MPLDLAQLRAALVGLVTSADAVTRAAAQSGAHLDRARARAAARDIRRVAAKRAGSAAAVAGARARAAHAGRQASDSADLAARARVDRVDARADSGALHGRVLDKRGAPQGGLRVAVLDEGGKPLTETTTDAGGYYRLDIVGAPAVVKDKDKGMAVTDVKVQVAVYRDKGAVHRDARPFAVRLGQARYRELVVE